MPKPKAPRRVSRTGCDGQEPPELTPEDFAELETPPDVIEAMKNPPPKGEDVPF